MAFKNEYIPEADYEKYDLRRICGEHNEVHRGHMYSRSWAIDRERDAFLIQVWSHHEAEFDGCAFYWKGEWLFFEMRLSGIDKNWPDGSSLFSYQIKDFSLPDHMKSRRDEIIVDINHALGDYCGAGVFATCTSGTATLEFIGGN